jgi:hypothetical protein
VARNFVMTPGGSDNRKNPEWVSLQLDHAKCIMSSSYLRQRNTMDKPKTKKSRTKVAFDSLSALENLSKVGQEKRIHNIGVWQGVAMDSLKYHSVHHARPFYALGWPTYRADDLRSSFTPMDTPRHTLMIHKFI